MTKSIFSSIDVAFLQNIDEHLLRKLYTLTLVRQSSQSMFPVFHGNLIRVLCLTETKLEYIIINIRNDFFLSQEFYDKSFRYQTPIEINNYTEIYVIMVYLYPRMFLFVFLETKVLLSFQRWHQCRAVLCYGLVRSRVDRETDTELTPTDIPSSKNISIIEFIISSMT